MSEEALPVRLLKKGQGNISSSVEISADTPGASSPGGAGTEKKEKVEPQAQLVEVEPGVYDITVTCRCGEQTVVRCYSVEKPSATPTPTPTPASASKPSPDAAPVTPPASE